MKKKIYCSHRGFNSIAPENTLPAFGAAAALGADEIELDLWPSADGKIMVCHDPSIDRTTNKSGKIIDLTSDKIREADAGIGMSKEFVGVRIPYFEEILKEFGGRIIMNLHIKSLYRPFPHTEAVMDRLRRLEKVYKEGILLTELAPESEVTVLKEIEEAPFTPYDREGFADILRLLDIYNCRDSVYVTGCRDVLETAVSMAPDIKRCCLEGDMNYTIVEHGIEYGCSRVQFDKLFLTKSMIDKAHEHGIICNLFWSDDREEADMLFNNGIDVILTNKLQRARF